MPEIAYVNGRFVPLDQAMIHVEDRGFQFADAVYEVLRTYDGRLFAVAEHLDRLFHSLKEIDLRHQFTAGQLSDLVEEAVRRAGFSEALLYLQLTRGSAPRHRGIAERYEPTLVLTVRAYESTPAMEATREQGLRLITVPDLRWGRCDIKTVGLLGNVLAYHAARQAGAQDAIFVGSDGAVAETTAGNVFLVHQGRLRTPALGPRLLAGVTRAKILELAQTLGIAAAEETCRQDELMSAEEVFVTSTTNGVVPATAVDGRAIDEGRPGPVTRQLAEQFERLVRTPERRSGEDAQRPGGARASAER